MTFNMNVVAVAALLPVLLAQGSSSPRQLLDLARSLEPSEISIVLKAVQEAIDGKTFRLGPEMSDSPLKVRM